MALLARAEFRHQHIARAAAVLRVMALAAVDHAVALVAEARMGQPARLDRRWHVLSQCAFLARRGRDVTEPAAAAVLEQHLAGDRLLLLRENSLLDAGKLPLHPAPVAV